MAESGQSGQLSAQIKSLLQQPEYAGLIRPDKIQAHPSISDGDKQKYIGGIRNLWAGITTRPPEDPQHQAALKKLQQFTQHMAQLGQNPPAQTQQNAQAGGARPQSQGQPQQPQQNGGASQQQAAKQQQAPQQNGPNPPNQIPPQFRQQAESFGWLVPPANQHDPTFKEELKRRYADALWKQASSQNIVQQLQSHMTQLRNQGKDIPPGALQQLSAAQSTLSNSKEFIQKVMTQQANLRQQQSQQAARNANGPLVAQSAQAQQAATQQPSGQGNTANVRAPPQNAAVEAARQQQVNRTQSGSPVTGQPSTPNQSNMASTPTQQQNFQNMRPPFAQSPQTAMPNSAMGQPQSVQQAAGQPGQQAQAQQPTPFTHQNAMDAAAKSYANNATPQQAGTQSQIAGPQMTRPEIEKTSNTRWPISKEFRPQPPQAVSMPPSRPTMAAPNNGPMGMIGQPALAQPPTYSLHGPGDRVLDKKKLDELVRQVCGAGDGTSQQSLHPEVEESILQLADEFFDNVVTQACRLAKLRNGNTLEIRDIQLVLQKQYNIRIPGYATDEVRTVRKVQPTASHLQKMNAVQAAKVMGGKTDI